MLEFGEVIKRVAHPRWSLPCWAATLTADVLNPAPSSSSLLHEMLSLRLKLVAIASALNFAVQGSYATPTSSGWRSEPKVNCERQEWQLVLAITRPPMTKISFWGCLLPNLQWVKLRFRNPMQLNTT